MNDQKEKEKPQELILAKHLIDKCKFDEAEQLIREFEEKGGHILYDNVFCHLLKCELLLLRDLHEDVVKLAEQAYKESLGLGKNLLSVDILLIMAEALLVLFQIDKSHDIIEQGEELLKNIHSELPADYKQREAHIAWLKGLYYRRIRDADSALKYFNLSLSMREELGIKREIAYSLMDIAKVFLFVKVDYDRALKYMKQSVTFAEESGHKYCIGFSFSGIAAIYASKGDLDRAIIFREKSLTIFNELNNKWWVATNLGIKGIQYKHKGELDRALECLEQSLAIYEELGDLNRVAAFYPYLIQILIERGDIKQAQQCLHDWEQLNNQLKDKSQNLFFLLSKALILKKSLRTRHRADAEKILRQLLEDEGSDFELILKALTSLCELLLIEIRLTNNLEVLDEINPLIAQLLDIAEKSHSYLILCETYLLQAKLSLLTFNIKKAKRFLTQALQIAERFGLSLLTKKITFEKEELLKKLDVWEKLKESGAPMTDRLELARLDEKIVGLVYNRALSSPQLTEEKVIISKETKICLVCRGEVFGFSYNCKCGVNYCENCARALTNLENVCWACDIPIDYSKPVKPFKKEVERIKVQEKGKKEFKNEK